jgi:hypothetical protein
LLFLTLHRGITALPLFKLFQSLLLLLLLLLPTPMVKTVPTFAAGLFYQCAWP